MTYDPTTPRTHKRLTRREVLRGAAAAATAPYVLTGSALGAADLAPASDRVTVACVGVRNRGARLVKSLLGDRGVQVAAVCDVDRSVRRRSVNRAAGARGARPAEATDFRRLAARDDIDAAVVATPDHTHALIALAMLRAGKHVYVEPPAALTIRNGRRFADAAIDADRVVQVGSPQPASRTHRLAAQLVEAGAIGRLLRVEITLPRRAASPAPWTPQPVPAGFDYDAWLGPAPWAPYTPARCHYNWRFITDYSGGELTHTAWRALDLARRLIGQPGPVAVEAAGERFEAGLYDTFHRVRVEWAFAGGEAVACESGQSAATRLIGEAGWIDAETLGASSPEVLRAGAPCESHRTGRGLLPPGGSPVRQFIAAVRGSRPPGGAVEAAHRTATMCHLGEIAMRLGRPVQWDPAAESFVGDAEAEKSPACHRPCREGWAL